MLTWNLYENTLVKKNQSFTFDEIRIQVFQNVSVIWNNLSYNLISFVLFLKSHRVKAVGCFRGRAPSLMFDRILNLTLQDSKSEVTPPLVLHKGILNSPCFLILLIHNKHKAIRWYLGLTPPLHFLEGELIYWVDKAKNVWLIAGQFLKKSWMVRCSPRAPRF